ncbi:MAG TPA: SxtJ family membrane protein [Candidatus Acidoferrum sp.]|nr:SxtJ family membrane protein [Candidatus Acidoferrum sp.]
MSSNRRFGLVIVTACTVVYAYGLRSGNGRKSWLAAALLVLVLTLAMPRTLDPLKRLWLRLGGLLHLVMSPLLLGLFYYGGLAPIGLVMRWLGKDLLRLRPRPDSYWIERTPPGPEPRTMREIF